MFSCEDFRAELSNLLDKEVAEQVRQQLDHHLAECRTCQVLYDSSRKTVTILTDAGCFELSADLSEKLTARVLRALKNGKPG